MHTLRINLTFLLSLLLFTYSCTKDEIPINTATDFEEYIQDEMDIQNIPAMSVLIFKENQSIYEHYFGKANLEQNTVLAPDHLFLLASISKTVTATALLQLYDQGLFLLDDKINDYLSFEVNVPNQNTAITFKMLLTHTSAINDGSALDGQYYYGEDSPLALASFLENYLTPGGDFYNASENFHDFTPGTKHEYSNEGSALIAVLVEEISGLDFNTYCKQNIFTPLGMTNTHWRLDEISQTIVQPYEYTNSGYEAVQHYTFTDYPNGGLRSTTRDMFTFLSAFVSDGLSNNYQLLKAETVNKMISPQIPNIDDEVGLHLFLMNKNHNLWGHDGGEQGVSTILAFNPSTKIGAIVLSNQSDIDLDAILEEAYKFGLKQ